MSAIPLMLISAAAGATAAGGAALYTARGLHRRLDALHTQLDAHGAGRADAAYRPAQTEEAAPDGDADAARALNMPRARAAVTAEIRAAIADALAEERERELAEARAFWADQEARDDAADERSLLAGHGTEYEIAEAELDALLDPHQPGADAGPPEPGLFVPRQRSVGDAPDENPFGPALPAADTADDPGAAGGERGADAGEEPPELTAARRRHPSDPGFTLAGEPVSGQAPSAGPTPVVADQEHTVERLTELALARTPLADIRQGPLGTLDVYLFEDGTTLCLSPGHRETAERLCTALRNGDVPYLMGGSTVSGAYALSFGYGDGRTAYLLADRVITSR